MFLNPPHFVVLRYAVDGIRGGLLGRAERRTVIHEEMRRSQDQPGPQSYVMQEKSTPDNGGKMLRAFHETAPSALNWTWRIERMKREKSPSPANYCKDLSEPLRLSGGRWSSSKFERDKWLANTATSPGPAAYNVRKQNSMRAVGGLISGQCKSELDWHLLSASKSPAPGDYTLAAAAQPLTRPLSFGSCRKDVCDPVLKADGPGPGSYEVKRGPATRGVRIAPPSATGRGQSLFHASHGPGEPSGPLPARVCSCMARFVVVLFSDISRLFAGPGAYEMDKFSISRRLARPEPLRSPSHRGQDDHVGLRLPGAPDPVFYGHGPSRRSLSGDWRAIQALAHGWAASARAVHGCLEVLTRSALYRGPDGDSKPD